ncbi:MAG: methyltransferase domain-containing protein [bacterium]|nr:methyltransferase domain-containing protein [bacterium]
MKFEDLLLLEQESVARGIPIVGAKKGKWLYDKIQALQPEKILELGSANGYSGCILGSTGAELLTIELDPIIVQEAKKNYSFFQVKAKVIVGDAVLEVEKLAKDVRNHKQFDIIFIDFAKKKYFTVLENCISLLKTGGYIIADNIMFLDVQEYRKRVQNHPQLQTEIILILDGLACSQKVSSH